MHSHYFRYKSLKQFKDTHLLIYGLNYSGEDILYMIMNDIE